jgi:hypothetical protein
MASPQNHPTRDLGFLLWPPPARRALSLPSLLHPESGSTLWNDIREVLLDPAPDPAAAETIHRWLRDEIQADLERTLSLMSPRDLVTWAARMAPQLLWRLPCSVAHHGPSARRRIIAAILPSKLKALKEELARIAFRYGL